MQALKIPIFFERKKMKDFDTLKDQYSEDTWHLLTNHLVKGFSCECAKVDKTIFFSYYYVVGVGIEELVLSFYLYVGSRD